MDEDASRAYEEVCLDRYDKLSHLFLLPGFLKSRIMLSKFFFFFFLSLFLECWRFREECIWRCHRDATMAFDCFSAMQ